MESTTVNFIEKWIMGHTCKMSALLFLVSAAAVLSACGSSEAESFVDTGLDTEFTRVINVEVSPIVTEPFIEEIRLTSVATANQVDLSKFLTHLEKCKARAREDAKWGRSMAAVAIDANEMAVQEFEDPMEELAKSKRAFTETADRIEALQEIIKDELFAR